MSAHTHDATPASPRVRRHARRIFAAILLPALLVTLVGAWVLWPTGERPVLKTSPPGMTFPTVTVQEVFPEAVDPLRQVRAATNDGSSVWVQVPPEYLSEMHPGDRTSPPTWATWPRRRPGSSSRTSCADAPLALLAARLRGARARRRPVARARGPGRARRLLRGDRCLHAARAARGAKPALAVALVTASAIMFVVLYLAHGFTRRTSTALLGTLARALAITAVLAAWASGAAHLTGSSTRVRAGPAAVLRPEASACAGILLCGIVLAGLGVLNDVTITQASAVWELRAAVAGRGPARAVRARHADRP